jgi:hypothetical protein
MHLPIISLHNVQVTGRSMAELTETEIGQLTALRDAAYDRPGTWAGNILCFHYDLCQATPSGGNGEGAKSLAHEATTTAPAVPAMRLYPNPANVWVAVDVSIQAPVEQAQLRVLDATGKALLQRTLAPGMGQVVLDTRSLAPGLYLVELFNAGQRLGGEQLIVRP